MIGIILGLAQRNRGRKTSDPDACGASAAPGKMRTAASRNQRRAGKIVPGFQLGYFSLAHRTGCVGKADGSNSTTAVPVHRFETERQRLRSCRRWLRLLERDAGLQAIAALNGAPSISPVSTPHRHALPSAAVATTLGRAVVHRSAPGRLSRDPATAGLCDCKFGRPHCFCSSFWPEASVYGRWQACCVLFITEAGDKSGQNRPNETILRKPRNHPETHGA